jgi:S-adenosyl-L-methionine hydrolase (adenosine-forming)
LSRPIITLLSDLGSRDPSVTVAKAILTRHAPETVIVDISHKVAKYDLRQAAYLLLAAYRHFPEGSIHVLPLDIFNGDAPRLLLAKRDGHFFIAPDNGLLPIAFGEALDSPRVCAECSKPYIFTEWMTSAGEIIESIRSGSYASFPEGDIRQAPWLLAHQPGADGVDCGILYTDRFENVVLNINKEQFEQIIGDKPFAIKVLKTMEITAISNNYTDVPVGVPLCRFNASGFLEIALNHGSAAAYLGLGAYSTGMRYPAIRIFFR